MAVILFLGKKKNEVGEFIVSCREYCCSLYAVTSLGFSFCVSATAALPTELELYVSMLLKNCRGEACDAHVSTGVMF